jgi:hypothetical protein
MRFVVNETATGIVKPDQDLCKVVGCTNPRLKKKRPHAFCKKHAGFRKQISKKKFKEILGNSEMVQQ